MNVTSTLKIPTGTFSHSDLAEYNGKTNQNVWAEYSRLRNENIIVSVGSRPNASGKGKPTLLWKLADDKTVEIVPEAPKPERKKRVAKEPVVAIIGSNPSSDFAQLAKAIMDTTPPKSAEKPFDVEMGGVIVIGGGETIVDSLSVVRPTIAPIVDVIRIMPATPPPFAVQNLVTTIEELDKVCPFCQTKLLSMPVASGVRVWCPVNDIKICSSLENPYGVANNVANAIEVLHEKYFKHKP